jgi:sialic acid synthase SpsE
LKLAQVMYASPYMAENPMLSYIDFFAEWYGRKIGYSDHTVGIQWPLAANRHHGCKLIEKHFTLTRDIYYDGKQFRDAIHGAMPRQLELLAGALR